MGPWFCEQCTARYPGPGDCAQCPEEPLLDLRNEDVLIMLDEFDHRRWRTRAAIYTVIVGILFLPFFALIGWVKLRWIFIVYGLATAGVSSALISALPPKKRRPADV